MKISIITVAYNSEKTIRDTIESVLSQTFQDIEFIIIDGISSDATMRIVEGYRDRITKIVSEPDSGIYDAMNKGLRLAEGDVIGFLNSDDVYEDPGTLEEVVRCFERHQTEALYGDLVYFDHASMKVTRTWISGRCTPRSFYHGWMPPHPAFFVRKSAYERLGGFRTDLGSAADYELMLRFLCVHGISVHYLPRVLVRMRAGGVSNQSLKARIAANKMDRQAWKVNGLTPYPWTILWKPLRKIPQYFVR